MSRVLVVIAVEGLSLDEAASGIPDLLSEIAHRPWMTRPNVEWDDAASRLIVQVEVDGEDPTMEAEGVYDEIWDCVIATIHFSAPKLSFHIDRAQIIRGA